MLNSLASFVIVGLLMALRLFVEEDAPSDEGREMAAVAHSGPAIAEVLPGVGLVERVLDAPALFAIRWKVGELLGWDHPDAGHGFLFRYPAEFAGAFLA